MQFELLKSSKEWLLLQYISSERYICLIQCEQYAVQNAGGKPYCMSSELSRTFCYTAHRKCLLATTSKEMTIEVLNFNRPTG